jgi:hypothetical protein
MLTVEEYNRIAYDYTQNVAQTISSKKTAPIEFFTGFASYEKS